MRANGRDGRVVMRVRERRTDCFRSCVWEIASKRVEIQYWGNASVFGLEFEIALALALRTSAAYASRSWSVLRQLSDEF